MSRKKRAIGTKRVTLTCDYCGKEFQREGNVHRWKAKLAKRNGYPYAKTFCNNECNVAYSKTRNASEHPRWKGGSHAFYRDISRQKGGVAVGRPLKTAEVVHHINMDFTDTRNCNLLVCDAKYHKWLHWQYERKFAEGLSQKPAGV